MNETTEGNSGNFVKVLIRLLSPILLLSILTVIALYLFAARAGLVEPKTMFMSSFLV